MNKIHTATRDSVKIIYNPIHILSNGRTKGYGHRVIVKPGSSPSLEWLSDSCGDPHSTLDSYKIKEATPLEALWFENCLKAKKLVEEPKEVLFSSHYPIF